MLLLKNLSLVLTIPLASLKLSTISIRFAFLIFLFTMFLLNSNVYILGGLFKTTILLQSLEIIILGKVLFFKKIF
jgi:hypothetical protein